MTVDSDALAFSLQPRLQELSRTTFLEIIDAVFNEFDTPDRHIRIESLTVDLGVIAIDEFEWVAVQRFEHTLREALHKAVHDADIRPSAATLVQSTSAAALDLIERYLLTGTLPSWAPGRTFDLETSLAEIASTSPDGLARLFRRHGKNERVFQRLAHQLSGEARHRLLVEGPALRHFDRAALEELIRRLAPEHAETIVGDVTGLEHVPIAGRADLEASRLLWLIAVDARLAGTRQPFDRQAFVRSMVAAIATREGRTAGEILEAVRGSWLTESEVDAARQGTASELRAIIGDLTDVGVPVGASPVESTFEARRTFSLYDRAEASLYFLRHGVLPWSVSLGQPALTVDDVLATIADLALARLQETLSDLSPDGRMRAWRGLLGEMSEDARRTFIAATIPQSDGPSPAGNGAVTAGDDETDRVSVPDSVIASLDDSAEVSGEVIARLRKLIALTDPDTEPGQALARALTAVAGRSLSLIDDVSLRQSIDTGQSRSPQDTAASLTRLIALLSRPLIDRTGADAGVPQSDLGRGIDQGTTPDESPEATQGVTPATTDDMTQHTTAPSTGVPDADDVRAVSLLVALITEHGEVRRAFARALANVAGRWPAPVDDVSVPQSIDTRRSQPSQDAANTLTRLMARLSASLIADRAGTDAGVPRSHLTDETDQGTTPDGAPDTAQGVTQATTRDMRPDKASDKTPGTAHDMTPHATQGTTAPSGGAPDAADVRAISLLLALITTDGEVGRAFARALSHIAGRSPVDDPSALIHGTDQGTTPDASPGATEGGMPTTHETTQGMVQGTAAPSRADPDPDDVRLVSLLLGLIERDGEVGQAIARALTAVAGRSPALVDPLPLAQSIDPGQAQPSPHVVSALTRLVARFAASRIDRIGIDPAAPQLNLSNLPEPRSTPDATVDMTPGTVEPIEGASWPAHRIRSVLAGRAQSAAGGATSAPSSTTLLATLIAEDVDAARQFIRALKAAGLRPASLIDEELEAPAIETLQRLLSPDASSRVARLVALISGLRPDDPVRMDAALPQVVLRAALDFDTPGTFARAVLTSLADRIGGEVQLSVAAVFEDAERQSDEGSGPALPSVHMHDVIAALRSMTAEAPGSVTNMPGSAALSADDSLALEWLWHPDAISTSSAPVPNRLSEDVLRHVVLRAIDRAPARVREVVVERVGDPEVRRRWATVLSDSELVRIAHLLEPRTHGELLAAAELLFSSWLNVTAERGAASTGRALFWSVVLEVLSRAGSSELPLHRLVRAFFAEFGGREVEDPARSSSAREATGTRLIDAAVRDAASAGDAAVGAVLANERSALLAVWRNETPAGPPKAGRQPSPRSALDSPPRATRVRTRTAFSMDDDREEVGDAPIYIANAGLILASPFFPQLFKSLEMLERTEAGATRLLPECISRAVHLLQSLVDGRTSSPEPLLCLNKLLCGVALPIPIERAIDPTPRELELCRALLTSMIANWPILRNTSVEGLQETFLQREGRLQQTPDGWRLLVQRKTLDVLLDRIPWSISTIIHPWMPAPIFVTW